jgi:hypothetical protein
VGTANGFDIAKLFVEGLKSGNANGFLHQVKDFEGAFGRYGIGGDNSFSLPATVKVVRGSSIVFQ